MTAPLRALRLGPVMGVRLVVRSAWSEPRGAEAVAYEFDQARVVIGRSAGADVQLPHPAVSAAHASLRVENTGYVLVDEGSTNGTRVNGARIVPGRAKPLRSGDRVEIGGFVIDVQCSVPVGIVTSAERTSALARHLVREALAGTAPVPPVTLTVIAGPDEGARLELPPPPAELVIGRGEAADLRLTDADCSRAHVTLARDLEGVLLRDCESKNGVLVGEKRVRERRLRDRETIRIGATTLLFEDPAEDVLRDVRDQADLETEAPSLREATPGAGSGVEAVTPPATEGAPGIAAAPAPASAHPRRALPSFPVVRSLRPAADMIVYMLAGAVLALSAAGLWLLLRAS